MAFRSGERDALEQVYRTFARTVGRVLRAGLAKSAVPGSLRAVWVADLTQETFVRAFSEQGRRGYDGSRDYGPYLVSIACHALSDWLRREGREASVDAFQLSLASAADRPEPWDDPRVVDVLEAYVAALDEPLRSLHRKRYVEGLSQGAAAAALGLTRQNVRTLEDKLRRGLADALRVAAPVAHELSNQDAGSPVSVRRADGD